MLLICLLVISDLPEGFFILSYPSAAGRGLFWVPKFLLPGVQALDQPLS
jgi:hypothetical protein